MTTPTRTQLYMRYRVEQGLFERYGWDWQNPKRDARIKDELDVIEYSDFSSYFLILADIMEFCRRENIPYGPGRGSVGGSFVAFALGIHEIDSLEWGLIFERFLTQERVSYPDVDLDFSQEQRPRVIQYIRDTYGREGGNTVLQVGAFARMGGRSVIDNMRKAHSDDPTAGATAENLKSARPKAT